MTKKDFLTQGKSLKILARARYKWHINWKANNFSANGNNRRRTIEKASFMYF